MFTAKIHTDRARAEQNATQGTVRRARKNSQLQRDRRAWDREKGIIKEGASIESVDDFRAKRDAALAPAPVRSSVLGEARRKRSRMLAMVRKRVEMLHMNAISREFPHALVSSNREAVAGSVTQERERRHFSVPIFTAVNVVLYY